MNGWAMGNYQQHQFHIAEHDPFQTVVRKFTLGSICSASLASFLGCIFARSSTTIMGLFLEASTAESITSNLATWYR